MQGYRPNAGFGRVWTLKLALGLVLLLTLLLWQVNLTDLASRFMQIESRHLLFLLGVSAVLNWISAAKWDLILRERGLHIGIMRLNALYLIGKFFNNFAPSMIGGDLARTLLLGKNIRSQSRSAASVLLERFSGLIALLILAFVFALIRPQLLHQPLIAAALAGVAVACLAALALVLFPTSLDMLPKRFRHIRALNRISSKLGEVHSEIIFFRRRYSLLGLLLAYSVFFYLMTSVSVYLANLAVGFTPGFTTIALITPIVFLLSVVPVSPNNLGWWEWCLTLLLVETGAQWSEGAAAALLLRGVAMTISLFGGVLFLFERQRPSTIDAS